MNNQQYDWKEGTIDALQHMFEDKVDKDTIKQLFEENEHDIERTVDAILRNISASKLNDSVSDVENEFEHIGNDADTNENYEQLVDSQVSITEGVVNSNISCVDERINREVESVPIVELNISEVSAPHFSDSVNSAATYTISHSEIEGSTSLSLEEQLEALRVQLAEVTLLKMKADEEKKNGMRWCLNEMEKLKEEIQMKNTTIAQQEEEIKQLKKKVEDKAAKDGSKIDKFILESKQMLQEGVDSLSKQLNESVNRVQSEFKKLDDKDWVIVDRLKEFASDFKREIMELFKDPTKKASEKSATKQIQETKKPSEEELSLEEQRQLWAAEKASLESYNNELENRVKYFEQEKTLQDSTQEVQPNPAPVNVNPPPMPPMPMVHNPFYPPPQYYFAQHYNYNPHN
eukprot:TRINITY_DN1797_c0_g1_i1.p1 TRINITY_DN1797_c0_g1~~TRINITY_DN1797_c0_g1_i1.p1  ORF type:complete len:403 (+),score=150.39 TRINITY_DN1797_c0_g1_i1:161-1369(+)